MMGPKGSKKNKPDGGTSTEKKSQKKKEVESDSMRMLILATKDWNKNLSRDILVVLEKFILKEPPRFTLTQFILKMGQCNRVLRKNCSDIMRNGCKLEKEAQLSYVVPGWTTMFVRKKKNVRMLEEIRRKNFNYADGDDDDEDDDDDKIQYGQVPSKSTNFASCPDYPVANLPSGFPWIPDYKDTGKSGKHDDNGEQHTYTITPEEVRGLSENKKSFDSRHCAIVNALGRYTGIINVQHIVSDRPPNCNPYTVCDGAMILKQYPEVDDIKCLFYISTKSLATVTSLSFNFCFGVDYTLGTQSLSSAVYECGKEYRNYSRGSRGVEHLVTLAPNLVYLKILFPYAAWTDMSSGNIIPYLDNFNINHEFWTGVKKHPSLKYVMIEYWKNGIWQIFYEKASVSSSKK